MKNIYFFLAIVLLFQCKMESSSTKNENKVLQTQSEDNNSEEPENTIDANPSVEVNIEKKNPDKEVKRSEESWVELSEKDGFMVDIKYATKDNFTKKVIYDCGACYLRPEIAQALVEALDEIKSKYGYGIKLLDCYRPRPFQQRLWDVMPDKNYVAPPEKGSMHSRGTAIDLTLVDSEGEELDMGTPFDFFGEEAHQDYKGHSDAVNRHRYILRSTMKKYGLEQIRTEWWHYSYRAKTYPLEEWVWPCN